MVRYLETDVVLICFSVDDPDSLRSAEEEWKPEVGHFCPSIPYILVGNKSELRNDLSLSDRLAAAGKSVVSYNEGLQASQRIGAYTYLECSARKLAGIQTVFETAVKAALWHQRTASLRRFCRMLNTNPPRWMERFWVRFCCYRSSYITS